MTNRCQLDSKHLQEGCGYIIHDYINFSV